MRLYKGTLIATNKWVRTHNYTVKNSGHKEKKVLVEYALDPDWKLVAPAKPEEKTRDRYRFAVAAKPGEPAKLHVEEERTDSQQSRCGTWTRARPASTSVPRWSATR